MGLSRCTAWVGDKYIGEVISHFRTLQRKKNGKTVSIFFRVYPQKKPILLKKRERNWGNIFWNNLAQLSSDARAENITYSLSDNWVNYTFDFGTPLADNSTNHGFDNGDNVRIVAWRLSDDGA